MTNWEAVLAGAAGCYALKYLGSAIPQRYLEQPIVKRIVMLLPIALLSALVAVQTFANSQELVVDARVPALAAATVALKFKAPFILVVLTAAISAAGLRYFGLAI
jgi:branched-subunit amino acid transport protein